MGDLRKKPARIIASDSLWLESEAVDQLNRTAQLDGMIDAVGMPDLHPGKGYPIGAAFLTEGIIYPYLIGNDIGCGMDFYQTNLKRRKLKLDKAEKSLYEIERTSEDLRDQWAIKWGVEQAKFNGSLGTVGSGNHFVELQIIDQVIDGALFKKAGLQKEAVFTLVHTGSRGFGAEVLRKYVDQYRDQGIDPTSDDGSAYLEQHDLAVQWAKANRSLLMESVSDSLRCDYELMFDTVHNSVQRTDLGWLHRKGVNPASSEFVLIPGSRGSLTYLVKPTERVHEHLCSLPHGAGRKWKRSECQARLKNKYLAKELRRTKLNSRVVCENKDLLYEEAPEAYKSIDQVIEALVEGGLIEVVATLKPIITYKDGGKV